MSNPKVSVVIPMYNTEKYIRQCLISVLSQKFQDYEVIIVDDCSSDGGIAEVERLIPHFDDRLKLIRRSKQSGCAGIPRNEGIKAAAGKYIVFLDSDDMLLPTTLMNYFEIAEATKADVLHTEKVLVFHDDGKRQFSRDKLVPAANEAGDFVEDITFETNDLTERIKRYHSKYFFWAPWGKLFRREFLLKNDITFPAMKMSEDMIFCFKCLFFAKKYVRIPQIAYIYRERQGSFMRSHSNAETEMNKWLTVIVEGITLLDEFMAKHKFFNEHLDLRYLVVDFFMKQHFDFLKNLLDSLKTYEIEYLVYRYLNKNEVKCPALTAYLFTEMRDRQKYLTDQPNANNTQY